MRVIAVSQARPGMLVARELLDEKGQVLLHKNVSLTREYIRALESKGFTRICVKDPEEPAGCEPQEDISPAVRMRAHCALRNAFEKIASEGGTLRAESAQECGKVFEAGRVAALLGRNGPLAKVVESVSHIIENVLSRSVLAGLTSIKTADTALFEHSLDVCAVSVLTGHTVGLQYDWLRQLAAGSLLHDIGRLFLDKTVTGGLAVKQHTILGYELLRASEQSDILTPHVAYEHHERPDGQGLPRGLMAGNRVKRDRSQRPPIPTVLGEIAAVANAYDNLLSGDEKTPGLPPDETLRVIREGAGTRFNQELVAALLRVAPVYPKSSEVVVLSGAFRRHTAIVTEVHPARLDRPVIQVFRDAAGKPITPVEIDLLEESEIAIQCRI